MALPDPSITATLATDEQCISYLEQLRWPNGVACPNCGNQKISRFQAKGKSGKVRQICQCLDRECKYQFSATTGTIFHDSHLGLSKWFEAMRLYGTPGEPIPVNQLRFALDVQYKTAKNVADRIQQALIAGTIEVGPTPRVAEVKSASTQIGQPKKTTQPQGQPKNRPPRPPKPTVLPGIPKAKLTVPPPVSPSDTPTVVDSMLSVFTSAMNLGVKPPLAAVKYLKRKILD